MKEKKKGRMHPITNCITSYINTKRAKTPKHKSLLSFSFSSLALELRSRG